MAITGTRQRGAQSRNSPTNHHKFHRTTVPSRFLSSGTDTVHAYFDAIRRRDADAFRTLFTADAELVTAAGTFIGIEAIVSFYRDLAFTIEDLWPDPGPLIVDGDRIAVEIQLRMAGETASVADVFTMSDGRIERVAIYSS